MTEIARSARRQGIADADILHAVRHALRVVSGDGQDLYIGGDRHGRLLEVVVLSDEPLIIHAMPLRRSFYEHLR